MYVDFQRRFKREGNVITIDHRGLMEKAYNEQTTRIRRNLGLVTGQMYNNVGKLDKSVPGVATNRVYQMRPRPSVAA